MEPDTQQGHQVEEGRVCDDAYEQYMRRYLRQGERQEDIRRSFISNRSRISEEEIVDFQQLYDFQKQQNEELKAENEELYVKLRESRRAHLEALKNIRELKSQNTRLGNANRNNGQVLRDLADDLSNQVKQAAFLINFSQNQQEIQRLKHQLTESKRQSDQKQRQIEQAKSDLQKDEDLMGKKDMQIERPKQLLKQANDKRSEKDQTLKQMNQNTFKREENLIKCDQQNMTIQKELKQPKQLLEQSRYRNSQQNQETKKLKRQFEESQIASKASIKDLDRKKDIKNDAKQKFTFKIKSQSGIIMIDSMVLKSEEQFEILFKMFTGKRKPKRFQLLFRGSDHGFSVKNNKEKYCGVAHTVLLVKTEYGKVIGGYTPLEWKILKDLYGKQQHDTSGQSFVFSISNNHKLTLEQPMWDEAIYHNNGCGPIFCRGICIHDESNFAKKSSSLYYDRLYYVHPEYKGNDQKSQIKFVGSPNSQFYTQQWEVHQVIFEE